MMRYFTKISTTAFLFYYFIAVITSNSAVDAAKIKRKDGRKLLRGQQQQKPAIKNNIRIIQSSGDLLKNSNSKNFIWSRGNNVNEVLFFGKSQSSIIEKQEERNNNLSRLLGKDKDKNKDKDKDNDGDKNKEKEEGATGGEEDNICIKKPEGEEEEEDEQVDKLVDDTQTEGDGDGEEEEKCINVEPVAGDDIFETIKNTALRIDDSEILKNDYDINGDVLSIKSCENPSIGNLQRPSDAFFVYTPRNGFTGLTTFECEITDGELTVKSLITVNVSTKEYASSLGGPDRIAIDDNINMNEDTVKTINPTENDVDGVFLLGFSKPINGVVEVVENNGFLKYIPNEHYFGADSFQYTVIDGKTQNTGIATVYITVSPVDEAPVANPDKVVTSVGQAVVISVFSNDFDPDGDTITLVSHTKPSNGLLVHGGNGVFTYTPDSGFVGEDSFEYTISDGVGGQTTTKVTISVEALANQGPIIINSYVDAFSGDPTIITVEDILSGGTRDPDGDPLIIDLCGETQQGFLGFSLQYLSNDGFEGQDFFTCRVCDIHGSCGTVTIFINVGPEAQPPVAVDDEAITTENTPVIIAVLSNDYDPDGSGVVTLVQNTDPRNGSLEYSGSGLFTYTPNFGFIGRDNFEYTIKDDQRMRATAKVTISVEAANDAPIAMNDMYTINANSGSSLIMDVVANDIDPREGGLSLEGFTQPRNGLVVENKDGTLAFTPDDDFIGQDLFTYIVSDGINMSNEGVVIINVVDGNSPPQIADNTFGGTTGVPLTITIPEILEGTVDPDGNDDLFVESCGLPQSGDLILLDVAKNTEITSDLVYTSTSDFEGQDSFTCLICDSQNECGTTNVYINISNTGSVTPPVAIDDVFTIQENTQQVDLDVLANDKPTGDDSIYIAEVTQPVYGSITISNDQSLLTYFPDQDFSGIDLFEYIIMNGAGDSDTGKVLVTVEENMIPIPLTAQNDYYATFVNSILTIGPKDGILANDEGSGSLKVVAVTRPRHGEITQHEDGSFTYTPESFWVGADFYTYEVEDEASGQKAQATVLITTHQATAVIVPGLIGDIKNGTSSDCQLNFTDCSLVSTVTKEEEEEASSNDVRY